jgi:hypothetical protein
MTKQILAFLFYFTRELNLYTPLTDIVIIHIFYINESNPYTPLVTISHIQICYQLLQTHPTREKRYQLLQTHPLTLLSARVTYERQSVGSFQNPITIQNNHANNHANNHVNNHANNHTDNHILAFQNLQDLWSFSDSP